MIKKVFKIVVLFVFLSLTIKSQAYNSFFPTLTSGLEICTILLDFENDYQDIDFTISPNPAKNKLNITLPSGVPSAKVSVFNVLGKLVYSGEISNFNGSINISNWNSGVYLVKVNTNNLTKTKRFIKQ